MLGGVTRSRLPVVLSSRGPPRFPDPRLADRQGLVAAGGSLEPEWLLTAYELGIFPWYDDGVPPLWWSPDPRALLDPAALHVSKSMRRFLRTTPLRLSHNRAFRAVMQAAAEERDEGTWILPEMVEAYCRLHQSGYAHSFEVWNGERLVGGLYGVQRGALFAAESMFHRETNASKLALIGAVHSLFRAGIQLFDVQFLTPHLVSLGAYTVRRDEYLGRLPAVVAQAVNLRELKLEPKLSIVSDS
jgi:leucyl/phenylalanyl-tRNA--protein transferase